MSRPAPTDTIQALASGALPAGIAVVRVSGPAARSAGEALTGERPDAGLQGLRSLCAADGTVIDRGLVLFFRGPHSFTGEDVLELQVHGSRAVVEALADRLSTLGIRTAEPGEFSRRAFENGRMDLTEVEGLADLIAAQTEAQRRLALAQHGGALRALYEDWAARLLRARALIEAEIDFADEDDVPGDASAGIDDDLERVASEMASHLERSRFGEIVRDGFRIALLGPPNAGKSSLLNAMVERDAAIVTDVPGTTRDLVEVEIERKGLRVVVTDTAGLRETSDRVEAEGIRRARLVAERADLRIWLSPEGTAPPPELDAVLLRSKADEGGPGVSVRRTDGLAALWSLVDDRLAGFGPVDVAPTRRRHREGVGDALAALREGLCASEGELKAEHLRRAAHALARITGRVDVEDLLGVIFSEFCVGK